MKIATFTVVLVLGLSSIVHADIFEIVITGEVEFNQINPANSILGDVNSGDIVEIFFEVDSDNFVDSMTFPTRGYEIIQDSFSMTMGAVTVGLQNPFPGTEAPFFVLRNDDPAVDGFLLASSPDVAFPNGVPLDEAGAFGNFRAVYGTTYGGDTLSSLNIADAVGFYDFTGLSVFSMVISDGPFEPMGMIFTNMTISPSGAVPEPSSAVLALLTLGLATLRRHRKTFI